MQFYVNYLDELKGQFNIYHCIQLIEVGILYLESNSILFKRE